MQAHSLLLVSKHPRNHCPRGRKSPQWSNERACSAYSAGNVSLGKGCVQHLPSSLGPMPLGYNTLWVDTPITHCHAAITRSTGRSTKATSRDSAAKSLRRDEPGAITVFSFTGTYFIMSLTSYNLILNNSTIECLTHEFLSTSVGSSEETNQL